MSYELTIEPLGQTIEVEDGQTILDAALRAGIYLPHACCHGLCATCKVQVVDGEVEHGEARIISKGSSLKICMVAEGMANEYPRFAPTMEWDTAAGHAIAKHAGFEMYLHDANTPLHYNKENLLNPWFIVKKAI